MIIAAIFLFCIPVAVIGGMAIECYCGRMDHVIRKISRPVKVQPILHDDFIDDCEQFNRAMLTVPIVHRVFDTKDTLQ